MMRRYRSCLYFFTVVVVRWGLFVVAEADLVVTVVIEGLAVAANAVMNSC